MFLVSVAALSGTAHAQNSAPSITSSSTFSVGEGNTAVATLTATDTDNDPLTWGIVDPGGDDGALFTLSEEGELAFVDPPDYETPADTGQGNVYEVTVQFSDGTASTTADLEVTVTDVAPALAGPATASHTEGKQGLRIAAYMVNDDVTWSLTGADSALFTITDGFLRFVGPPDFENAADANTDNVYNVIVQAGDGTATETTAVAVTVSNVDEPGTVTLSTVKPKLSTALTATLADADTVSGTPTWQWERNNGREGWKTIDGATAASYTPTAADGDRYLRATATYTDGFGSGKTAEAMAPHVVIAHRLSSLTFTGLTGLSRDNRASYPAFDSDWVDGLQQDGENRSNLALVNTGEVDGSDSVFSLEIYDGETGMLVKTIATGAIPAGRWHQINGILGNYAPGTRQGYIRILKISGNNPFLTYGVVNDGGAPGKRSGDGAYLPATE